MLIFQNAEGVYGQRKFGNTCPKPKPGQQGQTKWKCLLLWLILNIKHGSLICVETNKTEYEQNGEREKTVANNFIVRFYNFAKNKNFALLVSRLQQPGMTSLLKKLWADCSKTGLPDWKSEKMPNEVKKVPKKCQSIFNKFSTFTHYAMFGTQHNFTVCLI